MLEREEAECKEQEEAKRAWLLAEWERILAEKAWLMAEDKCKAAEECVREAAEKRAWVVAQQKAKEDVERREREEIAQLQAEREQAYAEKKVREEATRKQKAGDEEEAAQGEHGGQAQWEPVTGEQVSIG